jgi:hypothetical protein
MRLSKWLARICSAMLFVLPLTWAVLEGVFPLLQVMAFGKSSRWAVGIVS